VDPGLKAVNFAGYIKMTNEGGSSVTSGTSYKTAKSAVVSSTSRGKTIRQASRGVNAGGGISIVLEGSREPQIDPLAPLTLFAFLEDLETLERTYVDEVRRHVIEYLSSQKKDVPGYPDWHSRWLAKFEAKGFNGPLLSEFKKRAWESAVNVSLLAGIGEQMSEFFEHDPLSHDQNQQISHCSPTATDFLGSESYHSPWLPVEAFYETPATEIKSKRSTISRALLQIRTCHVLILLGAFTILASFCGALWRSVQRDDMSGGFTLASYILAVGVFIVLGMTGIHARTCVCWQKQKDVEDEMHDI